MIDIDKIFFVNLDHRTDRWKKIKDEFLPLLPDIYKDKVTRFSAVNHTKRSKNLRAAGAALSHLKIWKECIEQGLDTVLIFEDDIEWNQDKEIIDYYFNSFETVDFDLINLSYRIRDYFIPSAHKDYIHTLEVLLCSGYLVKVSFLEKMYNHVEYHALQLLKEKNFKDNAIDVAWNKFNFDTEELKLNTRWLLTKKKLVIQYMNYSDINECISDSEAMGIVQQKFYSCIGEYNEVI